ncbi:MAG: hypothetical protein NWQ19_09800 [Nonlabens sp.]|nr:hypothetical protein [Nonlabens sp.]
MNKAYQEIAAQLIALKNADLNMRDELIARKELGNGYNAKMESLHIKNATILTGILDKTGFPTINQVGKDGFDAACLIVQHAISQPKFMKRCATLLKSLAKTDIEAARKFAYLNDRIAVFENRCQLYGTQFDWDEKGLLSHHMVDDLIAVNNRRKELGWHSLEEQTEVIRKRAVLENQAVPSDYKKRLSELHHWKKHVGWIS